MKLNLIGKKCAPYANEQFSLKAYIIHQFPEHHNFFGASSSALTSIDGLTKILVDKSNLHAQQNDREFNTNEQEMRAFLAIN